MVIIIIRHRRKHGPTCILCQHFLQCHKVMLLDTKLVILYAKRSTATGRKREINQVVAKETSYDVVRPHTQLGRGTSFYGDALLFEYELAGPGVRPDGRESFGRNN